MAAANAAGIRAPTRCTARITTRTDWRGTYSRTPPTSLARRRSGSASDACSMRATKCGGDPGPIVAGHDALRHPVTGPGPQLGPHLHRDLKAGRLPGAGVPDRDLGDPRRHPVGPGLHRPGADDG